MHKREAQMAAFLADPENADLVRESAADEMRMRSNVGGHAATHVPGPRVHFTTKSPGPRPSRVRSDHVATRRQPTVRRRRRPSGLPAKRSTTQRRRATIAKDSPLPHFPSTQPPLTTNAPVLHPTPGGRYIQAMVSTAVTNEELQTWRNIENTDGEFDNQEILATYGNTELTRTLLQEFTVNERSTGWLGDAIVSPYMTMLQVSCRVLMASASFNKFMSPQERNEIMRPYGIAPTVTFVQPYLYILLAQGIRGYDFANVNRRRGWQFPVAVRHAIVVVVMICL